MSSRSTTRLFRRLAAAAAIANAFAAAAFAQGYIDVSPGLPSPNDNVFVAVIPFNLSPDPCVLWHVATRTQDAIRVEGGTTLGPGPCPTAPQMLPLGHLAAGRYRITAQIDGAAEPYAEARLDVSSAPASSRRDVDVALSPPTPRAGVPFALVFTATKLVWDGIDYGAPPVVIGDLVVLDGNIGYCAVLCPPIYETTGWRHIVPGLTAGNKTVEIRDIGNTVTTFGFHVDADTTVLPVADGRFEVSLRWTDRAGVAHDATAVRLSEESGQFWFFEPSNPEVTVKLVDGTGYNGHWWVFASSMTDLGLTLTIRSSLCEPDCPHEKRYTQTAGQNRNFIDTSAFQP